VTGALLRLKLAEQVAKEGGRLRAEVGAEEYAVTLVFLETPSRASPPTEKTKPPRSPSAFVSATSRRRFLQAL
jgi:hypothetical protein